MSMKAESVRLTVERIVEIEQEARDEIKRGNSFYEINKLMRHMRNLRRYRDFVDPAAVTAIIDLLGKCKGMTLDVYEDSTELKFSEDRYYNERYREIRAKIFKDNKKECMKCGSIECLELDHIKPVSLYPELFLCRFNMQILCKSCNQEKSNKNEIDYRGVGNG